MYIHVPSNPPPPWQRPHRWNEVHVKHPPPHFAKFATDASRMYSGHNFLFLLFAHPVLFSCCRRNVGVPRNLIEAWCTSSCIFLRVKSINISYHKQAVGCFMSKKDKFA